MLRLHIFSFVQQFFVQQFRVHQGYIRGTSGAKKIPTPISSAGNKNLDQEKILNRRFLHELIPAQILERIIAAERAGHQFQNVAGVAEAVNLREGKLH